MSPNGGPGTASWSTPRRTTDCAETALRAPFHLQDTIVEISVSIGTAVTRDPAVCADSVLEDTDTAMYRAKGRLRVPLATGPRNG